MLRATIYVLIALFLTIGCQDDDNPVAPPVPKYDIQITNLPTSITSPEGVSHEVIFQVTVINNATNEVVEGAAVALAVPLGQGSITPQTMPTDVHGTGEAMYSFDMPSGKSTTPIFITAEKQSTIAFIVLDGTTRPVELLLTADETLLFPEENESVEVNLTAAVTDERGMGIAGVKLFFELIETEEDSTYGALTPISTTDKEGLAQSTFRSMGGHGTIHIRCSVDEGEDFLDVKDEVAIRIVEPLQGGILFLNASENYIYADNGVTDAIVRAVLKDRSNQAIEGAEIIFSSNNNGAISSPHTTDSLGIALSVFTDIGIPSMNALGEREPCTVTAYYYRLGLAESIEIDIRPQEHVDNIVLAAGKATMHAGSRDTTWVRATCFLDRSRTQLAPEGTMVYFEQDNWMGSFTQSQVPVGRTGTAQTAYVAGTQVGQAIIRAIVVNEDWEYVHSNEVIIDLIPGAPASIYVQSNPSVLRIGEAGEQSMILASVVDSFGNPVRDGSVLVQFSTTLGTVDPPSTPTDSGHAIAFLRPGVEAGVAIVRATVLGLEPAETAVSFIAGGGSSINLGVDDLQIPIGGFTRIHATVRDANGNLIEVPTKVVIVLLTNDVPPEAGNINGNDPFYCDTVYTSNGIATFTFNAGTRIGPQLIRIYTLDEDGNPTGVRATISTLMVVGGPPAILSLGWENDVRDAGGGSWILPVSAHITDQYRNPARDEIVVNFRVDPVGSIESHAFTNGGRAVVDLTYHSEHVFEEVTVTAYLLTEDDSLGQTLTFQLPFQGGELELHVDPNNWMFDRDEPDNICDIRVWAILHDGHGVLINNAPILFTSIRGKFWYDNRAGDQVDFEIFEPRPVRRHTGPVNDGGNPNERQNDDDPDGHAVVWLRGIMDDFFLDPFSMEVTVQIEANVEGYDDVFANPAFVVMTRH